MLGFVLPSFFPGAMSAWAGPPCSVDDAPARSRPCLVLCCKAGACMGPFPTCRCYRPGLQGSRDDFSSQLSAGISGLETVEGRYYIHMYILRTSECITGRSSGLSGLLLAETGTDHRRRQVPCPPSCKTARFHACQKKNPKQPGTSAQFLGSWPCGQTKCALYGAAMLCGKRRMYVHTYIRSTPHGIH